MCRQTVEGWTKQCRAGPMRDRQRMTGLWAIKWYEWLGNTYIFPTLTLYTSNTKSSRIIVLMISLVAVIVSLCLNLSFYTCSPANPLPPPEACTIITVKFVSKLNSLIITLLSPPQPLSLAIISLSAMSSVSPSCTSVTPPKTHTHTHLYTHIPHRTGL